MPEGALDGVRVVDLTRVLAGPLCAMWLGDMGADVIKVERPGSGDDTRAWGPPFAGTEAAYFLGVNRNKRSLTLDLGQPRGLEILAELIRGADVVLDNFKIGTLDRWGFTDEWYAEEAPAAVRATISGYGSTGPKAAMPGYDFILQAETGLMAITGEPDGESMKLGVAIVDVCTGMLAAMSVLGGLAARGRTGKGQRIELSLHDTGLQMLANVAANHLVSGAEAVRYGNGHPNIVPYRTYPTADGELVVTVGNDTQFARFAQVLGCDGWSSDPRFARNADRVANRDLLDGLIRDRMVTRTRTEWSADLEANGIPCVPINSVAEALASPQTTARGMVTTVAHPTAGEVALTGVPFRMFGTPAAIRRPPPTLGQHSREVLASELGLDAATISELVAAGVTTVE
ncbi:MAG: CoA transferase [Acidimicrobiaceae bacterium]|nr:CoA transferase [Acidimicrobiaceae bacterium]MYL03156.1 CoA transferase [Acidimicrobiaceae bacterium]